MLEDNSTRNVFRFMQIRPPKVVDPEETVTLLEGTNFAKGLAEAKPAYRAEYANKYVGDDPRRGRIIVDSASRPRAT
jgi:hypothetical protein